MKKRIKKQNRKIDQLKELLSEACNEINDRSAEIEHLSEELQLCHDFIHYHNLEKSYLYFRMQSHKEKDPDLPFEYHTL